MNEFNVEARLSRAVSHATPNVLDNILSQCAEKDSKIVNINSRRGSNKTMSPAMKRRVRSIVAAAAALALVVGVFGFGQYNKAYAADSVISINADTDISLEISVNGEVVSVKAGDEDAAKLLEGLDLKGLDVEAAAAAIVEKLVEAGYVSEDANSILISVKNADGEKAQELQAALIEAVKTALAEYDIAGAITGIIAGSGGDAAEKPQATAAPDAEATDAKAALIEKALEELNGYTAKELGGLTVNELSLLIEDKNIQMSGVVTVGAPSDSAYVDAATAELTATAHAGYTEDGSFNGGVALDCKYGKLVYDVAFEDGALTFDYNIDAVSGLILSWMAQVTGSDITASSEKGGVSLDQATSIAIEHAGISMDDVSRVTINTNGTAGSISYDVQFAADGHEYEYDVDAATGAIIKYAAALVEAVSGYVGGSAYSAEKTPVHDWSEYSGGGQGEFSEMTPEDVGSLIGSIFELVERIG